MKTSDHMDLYELAVSSVADPVISEVEACPVCGATRAESRFEIQDFESDLVVCTECGLGRVYPLPSAEVTRDLYPAEYYGEETTGRKFHPLIEWLVRRVGARQSGFVSRGLGPGARVLDFGCGRGVMLDSLADLGFKVHGIDIREEATSGVDPRAEIRIVQTLQAAEYPDDFFDLVVVWHVLEHLRDPAGDVEEICRVLRPGGKLIVAVPNFASLQARFFGESWFHLDLPRHFYHFPMKAMEQLLVKSGFEVRSEHHFSLRQNPFGWIQSALNAWSPATRNGLYTFLYRRRSDAASRYDWKARIFLWFVLVAAAPLALVAAVFESVLKSGGTVHVVAVKRPPLA